MPSTLDTDATFAPPPGPPPPVLPDGWVARFDVRYQRFYYVNLATKKAQWEQPSRTIDTPAEGRVSGNPPTYDDSTKASRLESSSHNAAKETPQGGESNPRASFAQSSYHTAPVSEDDRSSVPGRILRPDPEPSNTCPYRQHQLQRPQHYDSQQSGCYQKQSQSGYVQSSYAGYIQTPPPHQPVVGTGTSAALGAGAGLLGGLLLGEVLENHGGYEKGFEDGVDFAEEAENGGGEVGDFDGGE